MNPDSGEIRSMPRRDRDGTLLDCKMPDEQPHAADLPGCLHRADVPAWGRRRSNNGAFTGSGRNLSLMKGLPPEILPFVTQRLIALKRPYMHYRRRAA